MKTLYLHIGTTKTATTSIQKFCAANQAVFESKGYVYPDMPFHYPRKSDQRNGLFLGTVYRELSGKRRKDIEEHNYTKGMEILHELFETHDSVVLSEERLWVVLRYKKSNVLQRLIEDSKTHGYQIKMILYLRRQDIYVESVWNQVVKMRIELTETLAEYAQRFPYLNYYEAVSTFAAAIGAENITVRRFDEAIRREGGILADFLEQIDLELTDEYKIENSSRNPGLYGNTAEIKRIINQMDDLTANDASLFRHSLPLSSVTAKKYYPCSEQSPEERAALMQKYEASNQALVEEFIGDGRPLFSSDYSGDPKRDPDNPELIPDIIRSAAASDVIIYRRLKEAEKLMAKQYEEMDMKIRALEKQVEKQARQIDHLRHPLRRLLHK